MTETLFESAVNARNLGCEEVAREIGKILVSWTFKGGGYQTGSEVLERGLCGLAAFAVNSGDEEIARLKTAVVSRLAGESVPEQEIRDRTAAEILERAANLYREEGSSSRIEMAITHSEKLRPLMEENRLRTVASYSL